MAEAASGLSPPVGSDANRHKHNSKRVRRARTGEGRMSIQDISIQAQTTEGLATTPRTLRQRLLQRLVGCAKTGQLSIVWPDGSRWQHVGLRGWQCCTLSRASRSFTPPLGRRTQPGPFPFQFAGTGLI